MRCDSLEYINERRDSLDQRWYKFLFECNLCPIPLPNIGFNPRYIEYLKLSGFILTGGNTLVNLGGDAPERDNTEIQILEYAIENKMPLLGVCRGMHLIQNYFGVELFQVKNHVNKHHKVQFNNFSIKVNSYHNFGANTSTGDLLVDARSEDGLVEAISHHNLPIKGMMWHPEREEIFSDYDIQTFKEHFQT